MSKQTKADRRRAAIRESRQVRMAMQGVAFAEGFSLEKNAPALPSAKPFILPLLLGLIIGVAS